MVIGNNRTGRIEKAHGGFLLLMFGFFHSFPRGSVEMIRT